MVQQTLSVGRLLVGLVLESLIALLGYFTLSYAGQVGVIALAALGAVMGLVAGVLQLIVLASLVKYRDWIVASAIGGAIAFPIALVGVKQGGSSSLSMAGDIVRALAGQALGGLVFGLSQAATRPEGMRTPVWVVARSVTWAVLLPGLFAAGEWLHQPMAGFLAPGLVAAIGVGASFPWSRELLLDDGA